MFICLIGLKIRNPFLFFSVFVRVVSKGKTTIEFLPFVCSFSLDIEVVLKYWNSPKVSCKHSSNKNCVHIPNFRNKKQELTHNIFSKLINLMEFIVISPIALH